MSRFEYLTAFLGIILAVAVAEILLGVGRLTRERDRVKFYWVHLFWMFALLVIMIQRWWASWQDVGAPGGQRTTGPKIPVPSRPLSKPHPRTERPP